MLIENGDEYQGFEIKEASENEIVLKNSKSITLNLDKDVKNYFTDSWYFQTSDEGKGSTSAEGYVIYPATDVTVEDKAPSGSKDNSAPAKEANVTEKANVTEEGNKTEKTGNKTEEGNMTEAVLNTAASEAVSSESAPLIQSKAGDSKDSSNLSEEEDGGKETSSKTPGFEVLGGVLGIALSKALLKRRN
jgi:DNA mismatch repair ATPase MutL